MHAYGINTIEGLMIRSLEHVPAVRKRHLPFKSPLKCQKPVSLMPLGSASCFEQTVNQHGNITLQYFRVPIKGTLGLTVIY